jgi:hypothetical protein
MNAFVLPGLMKPREQLAGDIEAAHEALRRMILDLENLDATIQQFDPTYQVEPLQGESNAIPIYTDTRNSKP